MKLVQKLWLPIYYRSYIIFPVVENRHRHVDCENGGGAEYEEPKESQDNVSLRLDGVNHAVDRGGLRPLDEGLEEDHAARLF